MTEEEKTSIFAAPEFLDFVEQSTKIIQRALNDNYDYVRDYTIGTETGGYVPRNSARRSLITLGQGRHRGSAREVCMCILQ